ncbi:MAG: glycosyltransferase family 2 protein [Nitrospinales bacterium]
MSQIALVFYCLLIVCLFIYAAQYWILIYLCPNGNSRNSNTDTLSADSKSDLEIKLPKITVQIPVFNERYMVARIINAVAKLDYPADRLQIQVLDDSTDDTPDIAFKEVEKVRAKGINIDLIHRNNRNGFKAGALAEGLKSAQGEFIAIFDADFVPRPNFLQKIIVEHRGFENPKIGFIQTRWVYLNRNHSFLTKAEGLIMDIHFYIDQPARYHAGLPFHFNGSGGIWRKTCIEDAGGWHFDTLCEDLDLSYRAKMKGWSGVYLTEEEAPNDLPTTLMAFKQQQKRWARGSAQCLRKLAPKILSSNFTAVQKLASLVHISGYFLNTLIFLFIIIWPFTVLHGEFFKDIPLWIHFLGLFSFAFIFAMYIANKKNGYNNKYFLRNILGAVLIGIGISVNNMMAFLSGFFSKKVGTFERTPKVKTLSDSSIPIIHSELKKMDVDSGKVFKQEKSSGYYLSLDRTIGIEIAVGVFSLTMMFLIIENDHFILSIPMLIYGVTFLLVGLMQVLDVNRSRNQSEKTEPVISDSITTNDATSPAE